MIRSSKGRLAAALAGTAVTVCLLAGCGSDPGPATISGLVPAPEVAKEDKGPAILDGWRAIIGDAAGATLAPPRFGLTPLLRAAMERGAIRGQHHAGVWTDVGTPERLAELDARLLATGT